MGDIKPSTQSQYNLPVVSPDADLREVAKAMLESEGTLVNCRERRWCLWIH
ncbi:MAG: hypothetical protein PWQ91_1275 [Eubacteriales bacterium]|nr:hypothetical protein [Eubacteriales bacterium]